MKLTRDQLFTLAKATEIREASVKLYRADADAQRKVWQFETERARTAGDRELAQDQWLIDVMGMIDAVQPTAPIYLLAEEIEVVPCAQEAVVDDSSRIVMWREVVGFFGNHTCVLFRAGTSRYASFLGGPWVLEALGMWAVSCRPATPRPVGATERHGLHRARYQPRRDFYYVPNVRHETIKHEPRGGHHASPIAHDRSAHRALLTRVSLESEDEVKDLTTRQYTIQWTEELPPEVLERMLRRGKQPVAGHLNAYRWIEKSASRVNAEGESARRVTLIR